MKYLITMLLMLFAFNVSYSQNMDSLKEVVKKEISIENSKLNVNLAGQKLMESSSNFNRAVLFPVIGYVISGVLLIGLEKKEGEIAYFITVPALAGMIAGVISYFNGTSDLKEAGRLLKGYKK